MSNTSKPGSGGLAYAGDIEARDAWTILKEHPKAQLIDVRSAAEWSFVGLPDLASLGRQVVLAELQTFPGMAQNPQFLATAAAALKDAGAASDTPILCLCRSGARSRAAAVALSNAGFSTCYNVAGGFEGDLDAERHRGRRNGWKAAGLPWIQS